MTKIIVFGAAGRMGTQICELASKNSEFEIVGALEHEGHIALGKTLNGKIQVTSDLNFLKGQAQAAIDFTTPEATLEHLEIIEGWEGMAVVIGTTGFSDKEKNQIERFSKKMAIVMSPNMSRGVNLMLRLVREAAQILDGYKMDITEAHHVHKKDAPSGTALALAEQIPHKVEIRSIREGEIVGKHTVAFATGGERLEIKHIAYSRDAFAAGALDAAQWAAGKNPGLYSMKDVLGT